MIKATRVGMTVVCIVGTKIHQKVFETEEEIHAVFEKVAGADENDAQDIADVLEMMLAPLTAQEKQMKIEFEQEQEKLKENQELLEWIESIKELGDEHFEVKGISLYMKGINITIPEFLATEFAKRRESEEDTESLINFWRLLSLNPDPRCREDLYKFLVNNHMVVTPSGYFLAYRNAQVKEKNDKQALYEFINAEWAKIKGWKKSPSNYTVLELREGEGAQFIVKADTLLGKWLGRSTDNYEAVGNLQTLKEEFEEKEQQTVYTDAHSRTTTIIIGQPVSIDRTECDANPDRTCSRGLHLGSTNFMSRNYFGSVGLVCLCNPMKVVAVPYSGGQKLRTSEYLPIGIAEYDDQGKIIPIESATFEYDYAEHTEEELEELLNRTEFESLKTHNIIPMEIKYEDFNQIITGFAESMDEMKKVIAKRVVKAE